ncbi:hypothetical protein DICPUDRAFT_57722 [Dictyostelium purpureum]|uniref:Saposin B-type domain-containing protein n=1 Tax=Dictyostelium purpureum TaxID=5786 RepID=F0ZX98_DICPU|nr:uncharacterized protein DICPUDRAFT_57722 [Dictyostelium purpureum]EGC31436.1 hypothetical protein DICPUDRAFT_57722 [Dictyostelium purpureum]|eukprot:XP_003292035.1 hypothetical protein DICPUDRAFT_57722 [Dictyostelium purpureum]
MKYLIVIVLAILALLSTSTVQAGATECEFCEFIANYVDDYVKQNKTISQIEVLVEKVCIIAGSNEEACKDIVQGYLGQIIVMLENFETPAAICAQLGFCGGSSEKQVQGGLKCDICSFLLKKIEGYITAGKTEKEIMSSLDGDCKHLHSASSICESMVDEYAPQIIQLLLNKENPDEVCKQIHLC